MPSRATISLGTLLFISSSPSLITYETSLSGQWLDLEVNRSRTPHDFPDFQATAPGKQSAAIRKSFWAVSYTLMTPMCPIRLSVSPLHTRNTLASARNISDCSEVPLQSQPAVVKPPQATAFKGSQFRTPEIWRGQSRRIANCTVQRPRAARIDKPWYGTVLDIESETVILRPRQQGIGKEFGRIAQALPCVSPGDTAKNRTEETYRPYSILIPRQECPRGGLCGTPYDRSLVAVT